MKTIDLHIIDIANNSIRAKASEILIEVKDSEKDNSITLVITDTGCGISPEKLKEINESFILQEKLENWNGFSSFEVSRRDYRWKI